MEHPTPVFIVCSPRPRVGKTLVARALAEFFRAEGRNVAAFDVNPDEFALVDYLPAFTAVASINDTKGEMALFDQLIVPDLVPKVVDLSHALFDRFFKVFHHIDFMREARRRSITPVVLFIGDPDRRSRLGYVMLQGRFPELALVPVLNEAVPYVARYREHFPPTRKGGSPLQIPQLTPVLKGIMERRSFSFASFLSNATDTTTELYGWTRALFLEFRELEVRLLLEELKPSLKFSA
jgi:hypothetical protein